ncbi:MAG: hypothetical protein LBC59_04325 [Chitinispirillales bacterium]|nr:hypothetical protein [Chitinispirillales bacterium]
MGRPGYDADSVGFAGNNTADIAADSVSDADTPLGREPEQCYACRLRRPRRRFA